MRAKGSVAIIATILLVTSVLSVYGTENKKSYIDDIDFEQYLSNKQLKVVNFPYEHTENWSLFADITPIHNLGDLEKVSSIVVKVKLDNHQKRLIYTECILSRVKVLEVYRGNLHKGDLIDVFEPTTCELKEIVFQSDGYNNIQGEKTYILFLKRFKNTIFGDQQYVYLPSTTILSKYEDTQRKGKLYLEKELDLVNGGRDLHYYKEVKDEEVLLYDEKNLEKFNKIKRQVLEKYGSVAKLSSPI